MSSSAAAADGAPNPALEPDTDAAAGEGLALAQFAAGCFWSVELTYQRLPGVARTEVGYSQGHRDAPTARATPRWCACTTTPRRAPTPSSSTRSGPRSTPPRSTGRERTSGRSTGRGIYYYTAEQERLARESLAEQRGKWEGEIVTEILPAKRFDPAEEYHQRYLEKGGQSAAKGCTDPMRCYG